MHYYESWLFVRLRTHFGEAAFMMTSHHGHRMFLAALAACLMFLLCVPAFAAQGTLSGCAYVDADGNGALDGGEQLITGVPVSLERKNAAGWVAAGQTKTDATGQYRFDGLAAGEYRVVCTLGMLEYYAVSVGGASETSATGIAGAAVSLADGQAVSGQDVCLGVSAKLTFTAYYDSNNDGLRGPFERALKGVTVEVMDGDAPLTSAQSNKKGEATLYVRPGSYPVRVTLPEGYAFTQKNTENLLGGVDASEGVSDALSFAAGQETQVAIGARPVGSLSGKAFEDMNNNGVMDDGEPGVEGVVVHLVGERTGTTRDLTTDASGEYRFDLLPDDKYTITATLPEGMLYARYSTSGGDRRSIFTGSVISREFSVKQTHVGNKNIGVVQKGAIRGMAFLDENYNGVYDEGEPGYAGVTLEAIKLSNNDSAGKAVSGEDGAYAVENLRGGEYRLRAILPNDGSIFSVTATGEADKVNLFAQRGARRENSIQPLTIASGGEAYVLVGVARGATISGTVFEDADYNGRYNGREKLLSGLKVYAVDQSGNVVATATTNSKGAYTLTGIMPGDYTIQFQRKAGYGFTRLRPDEKGGSHVVALVGEVGVTAEMAISMGEELKQVNAGMLPAATVSGVFFHDANDDGLQGAGELGMLSATVRLLSEDGEIDLTQTVKDDGSYFFDGVMPGRYTLTYQLAEHTEMADVVEGGNTVAHQGLETVYGPFEVVMGQACVLPTAGAVTLGSFAGTAFHDANGNGVMDAGETPLAGVKMTLAPADKRLESKEAVTGADGAFALRDLRPSEYTITVALPNGYILSRGEAPLSFSPKQSDSVSCPWSVLIDREPKQLGAVMPASIQGQLWLDENQDGQQGAGELLLSGVTLELVDESNNTLAQRVTSMESGFRFDNVRPGSYTIRFLLPNQSSPANDRASSFVLNSNRMVCSGIEVAEGAQLSGYATGLVSRTSIAGKVALDENGARSPVSGVTVMLFEGGNTQPIQTTMTDETGAYRFDGLWPNDYHIQASLPSGLIFVRPGDPNYPQGSSIITASTAGAGTSEMFFLQMAQHQLDMNIVYIKPAKVGDMAWLDENRNGLIDGGEPGIPGVTVRLMQNGKAVYETVTDAYGYYLFTDVYPGEYTISASAYDALTPTTPLATPRIIASCLTSGDGQEAASDAFSVQSGSVNVNYDLGYVLREGQALPSAITAPPTRDWSISNAPKE